MNILVTNDDSIEDPGIWALVNAVKDLGHVKVIAPEKDQSGVGAAVSFRKSVKVNPAPSRVEGVECYAVGGTPAVPGPQEVVAEGCAHAEQPSSPQPVYRLSWARLLARVFRVDVTECPACGGKMKIIAALTEPVAIRTYLDGVGLASRPPPIAPARLLPQTEFEYAG